MSHDAKADVALSSIIMEGRRDSKGSKTGPPANRSCLLWLIDQSALWPRVWRSVDEGADVGIPDQSLTYVDSDAKRFGAFGECASSSSRFANSLNKPNFPANRLAIASKTS